jgi:hypothetical protein
MTSGARLNFVPDGRLLSYSKARLAAGVRPSWGTSVLGTCSRMSHEGDTSGMTDDSDLVAPQTVRAIEELVAAVPELKADWEEHLSFHAEPLPYAFFGDVLQFALANLRQADPEVRRRFAMAINRFSDSKDWEIENLIAVAFFEDLVSGGPGEAATLEALRPWLSQGSLAISKAFEPQGRDRRLGE